jgi:hypothetical protein
MALETTKPLTKMSTRKLHGGKARPVLKAENLTAICEPIVLKLWKPATGIALPLTPCKLNFSVNVNEAKSNTTTDGCKKLDSIQAY